MRELLKGVTQVNEASSVQHALEEEQIAKMIEIAKLILDEMRKRNEILEKVEASCDILTEEVVELKTQVGEITDRMKSLAAANDLVEDVKPKLENPSKLPLPNILPNI